LERCPAPRIGTRSGSGAGLSVEKTMNEMIGKIKFKSDVPFAIENKDYHLEIIFKLRGDA